MNEFKHKSIATSLYDTDCIDEKFAILEQVVKDAGFDAILYTFIPKLSRLINLQPVFRFSNGYAQFIEHYHKNNFSKHDFLLRLLEEGITDPVDWWEKAALMDLTEEEKHVNNTARHKFGITKGLGFPTLGSNLGLAGVSIISFKKEDENRQIEPEIINSLHKNSRIYHDHMMVHQDDRYSFILPLLDSLTPKKKIVIKHLISGQPMKNIEDQGVTERYGEKLLLELRKSFGDITKNELIYLLGLLNITEYL